MYAESECPYFGKVLGYFNFQFNSSEIGLLFECLYGLVANTQTGEFMHLVEWRKWNGNLGNPQNDLILNYGPYYDEFKRKRDEYQRYLMVDLKIQKQQRFEFWARKRVDWSFYGNQIKQ
jgi:hypothetical protein